MNRRRPVAAWAGSRAARAARVERFLAILADDPRLTICQAARRAGVTERTAYRYLAGLRQQGTR